jgi:hypothetical protein
MAGLNPDWLALIGTSPSMAGIAQRFWYANSLETLKRILEPIGPDTTLLLYHLLQVVAWAAVGGMVGALADRAWVQRRRPWASMIGGAAGALVLLGAHVGLALWLDQYTLATLTPFRTTLISAVVMVALLVSLLEGLRDLLEHPLPPARRHPRRGSKRSGIKGWGLRRAGARAGSSKGPGEARREPLPVPTQLPHWEATDESEDLIMLELD